MAANPLDYLNPLAAFQTGMSAGLAVQNQRLAEKRQAAIQDLAQQQEARLGRQTDSTLATDEINRKALDVASQLSQFNLDRTKQEAQAELDDAVPFTKWQNDVGQYLDNPDMKVPVMPEFKSRQFRNAATQLQEKIAPDSPRAQLQKAAAYHEQVKNAVNIDRLKTATDLLQKTGIDPIVFADDGTPHIDETKFAEANQKAIELGQVSPVHRQAVSMAAQAVKLGKIMPNQVPEATFAYEAAGGKPPPLNAKLQGDLQSAAVGVDIGNDLVGMLDNFEERFGKDAFTKLVGPVSGRIEDVILKLQKANSPEAKAAVDIFQKFNGLKNQTLKTLSGQAVTQSEANRLEKSIGTTLNANFVRQVRNFRDQERRSLSEKLAFNPYADIPEEIDAIANSGLGSAKVRTPDGKVIDAPKFQNLNAALRQGHSPGDVILLYNTSKHDYLPFLIPAH